MDFFVRRPRLILRWADDIIAEITGDMGLANIQWQTNIVTQILFHKHSTWSKRDFEAFLRRRVFDSRRPDAGELLKRLGMYRYNIFEIAKVTRAFSLNDLFWLSFSSREDFIGTFNNIFIELGGNIRNRVGDPIYAPAGVATKSYGCLNNNIGVVKNRLHAHSLDLCNEVVAYRLGSLLGLDMCYAEMIGTERVFSEIKHEFQQEVFIPGSSMTTTVIDYTTYEDVLHVQFPDHARDLQRMFLFDFILNQEGRHNSNWGLIFSANSPRFYSIFGNGQSLFYEADVALRERAYKCPKDFIQPCGLNGSHLELVKCVTNEVKASELINFNISSEDIRHCFEGLLRYTPDRIKLATCWINYALETLAGM